MERVYLVECYVGSTLKEGETENFVSAICKTEEGAKKHVERQIKYWKMEMKVPKDTTLAAYTERNEMYNYTQIAYNGKYITYFITEKEIEE